jgi:hypothetical protein
MAEPIDEALLEVVQNHWLKVALVVAQTGDRLDLNTDEGLFRVADRLKALIDQGQIEVQGNPDRWRHSEIRKP